MNRVFRGKNINGDPVMINFDHVFLIQTSRMPHLKVVSSGCAIVSVHDNDADRFIEEFNDYIEGAY